MSCGTSRDALPVLYELLDVLQVRQIINRHCPTAAEVDHGTVAMVSSFGLYWAMRFDGRKLTDGPDPQPPDGAASAVPGGRLGGSHRARFCAGHPGKQVQR